MTTLARVDGPRRVASDRPRRELIGRRAEVATAARMIAAAARGNGGTLLVTGEAGIGKSRLLEEIGRRAAGAGLSVLNGRAVEGGGAYRALAEALARPLRRQRLLDTEPLRPYRAALQRLLPVAAPVALPTGGPRADPTVVLGEGVLAVLSELAGRRGCALMLEDLHWADRDTVDLMSYLAGAVSGTPVLLVLSARDESHRPGVGRLAAEPGTTVLGLNRLDEAGVGALAAASRGGEPLAGPELRELVARSDGLPFIVEELATAPSGSIPRSFAELVAARLAVLPDGAGPVLTAAAVVGGDPDWRLLGSIDRSSDAAVVAALRAATDVGLLASGDGGLRWRHALTREAVLATLVAPERAALASRAARVLIERGDPEDRAVAARLFVDGGDLRRGAEILLELARTDIARGALRSAAERLDRAAATGRLEGAVAVERVRALTLLGRAADAVDTGEAALAAGMVVGDEHAELCLRIARAAVVAGRWAAAESFVERAGRPDDTRSLVLAADSAYGAGDVDRAVALAERAVRIAEGTGPVTADDAAVLCEALAVLARSRYGPDATASEALLRRSVQVAAEHGLTPWRVEALFVLGSHEHTAGHPAAPALAAARELALDAGLFATVVQVDLLRSDALMLVDGPAAALPVALEGAERAGRLRLGAPQAMAEMMAAAFAALLDDLGTMRRLLGAAGVRADIPPEVATLGPMVRALPHLMRHDLPRACALFDEGVPPVLAHGSVAPLEFFGLWALLRTAVADRDRVARDTLRNHRVLLAAGNRAALGYADAIAAGRAGRVDEAAVRFGAADASIAHLPWWNRLLRSVALESAVVDGWGDPVPALRGDLAAHEQAGEDQLARTCRDLLRAAGAPARRGATPVPPLLRALGITSREAEVLALVAGGLTNAQVAGRLFLSTRTVDTHVSRLLAKTGSADRVALRRWAD